MTADAKNIVKTVVLSVVVSVIATIIVSYITAYLTTKKEVSGDVLTDEQIALREQTGWGIVQ